MPHLKVLFGWKRSLAILGAAFFVTSALSLPVRADDDGRVIQDTVQGDPQAEFKAPSAIVENAENVRTGRAEPLVIAVNGRRFEIPAINEIPQELRGHYEKMPADYQQMFHTNRVIFLTRAAQLLSTSFFGAMFGTGAIVKDRVRWTWDHMRESVGPRATDVDHPAQRLLRDGNLTVLERREVLAAIERENRGEAISEEEGKFILKSFQERRHEIVQRILLNLDRHFWSRPALVANSNEVGAFASIGVTGFLGAQFRDKKKGFGGSLDIGIFIGWNKSEHAAVVQIFRITESFRGTMTALTGNAAVVPKWGLMFSNMMKGRETLPERGVVHYPPTPPGVSSFFITSPNRFAAGMNPPFGLVPWPFDAVLLYSMDYVMKPMLRVAFRFEVLKDFIKVETGPRGQTRSAVKTTVARSVVWVQAKASGRKMCVGAHGM